MTAAELVALLMNFDPDTPVVGILQGRYVVGAMGVTVFKVPGVDGLLLTLEYGVGNLATCEVAGEG